MIEWHDTGLKADQMLVMALTVMIARMGGATMIERAEWNEIVATYGDHGALLFERDEHGSYLVSLGTTESSAQAVGQDENVRSN